MLKVIKKLLLVIILVFAFFAIGCGNKSEENEYSIHTELQNKYLAGDYNLASVYAKASEELSKPNGVVIDFSKIIDDASSYEFYLDLHNDFSSSKVYTITSKEITLYNLMIMTVYYYKVKTVDSESSVYSFIIKDEIIRNLDIDGVTNARDLGGYKVNDKCINQGLLYRMSKFNEDESQILLITENGIDELVNNLKIKTELDLRKTEDNEFGGLTSSPLGPSVSYIHLPMVSGGNCITLNQEELPRLFEILGDKNNYPLVFHCSIGTDRTGMVSFLVLNLLGVSRKEVYYDYLFSNFAPIGRVRLASTIDDYYDTISSANGSSDQEKTYNYLLSVGVSKSDLDSFIEIMTK